MIFTSSAPQQVLAFPILFVGFLLKKKKNPGLNIQPIKMNLMTVTCVNLKYCYIFYLQKLILHKFNINLSQKLIFPQKEKNESLML